MSHHPVSLKAVSQSERITPRYNYMLSTRRKNLVFFPPEHMDLEILRNLEVRRPLQY